MNSFPKRGEIWLVNWNPSRGSEQAGIRPGDVIYEVNRVPVKNIRDYSVAISNVSGDVLIVTYRGYVVLKENI